MAVESHAGVFQLLFKPIAVINIFMNKTFCLLLTSLAGISAIGCLPARAGFDFNKVSAWNQKLEKIQSSIGTLVKAQSNAERAGERLVYCDFNVKILIDTKDLVGIHLAKANYYRTYSMDNMAAREVGYRDKLAPVYNALLRQQIDCDRLFPGRWPFLAPYLSR